MNIEKGKWLRFKNNKIIKIVSFVTCNGEVEEVFDWVKGYYLNHANQISKTADTPQELIEVGDLVEDCNSMVFEITRLHHNIKCLKSNDVDVNYKDITKILTPNSNGGYDLQWSATVPTEQRTNERNE